MEDPVVAGVHLPSWLPGDCPFYRAAASAIAHGRLDLRGDPLFAAVRPEGQVALGLHGEWYPKHPLLLPLLAVPFQAAAGDAGLLGFNLLELLALDLLMFALALRVASPGIALGLSLLYALATLLRPVALNFSPDVLAALLPAAGYLALVSRRPGLAGLLFGLAVCAKWTNLALLAPAAIYAVAVLGAASAARFALAAAPPLLALAMLNQHMFGSPWVTPYDRVLTFGGALEPSHRTLFDQPFWRGLWTQIADRRGGLLASAPPVLLALPGLLALWPRSRAEALLVAGLCAAQMAVFAPYRLWSASNFGHRFWMLVVVLSIVPAAALVEWAAQRKSQVGTTGSIG